MDGREVGQALGRCPGQGRWLPPDFPNQLLSLPAQPQTHSFPEVAYILHSSFTCYPDQVTVYLQAPSPEEYGLFIAVIGHSED